MLSVLETWFGPCYKSGFSAESLATQQGLWWAATEAVDRQLEADFGGLLAQAKRGELDSWLDEPRSALALIILCDQFSRNIHRGTKEAFEMDGKTAQWALQVRGDFHPIERCFLLLPLEHSENLEYHDTCIAGFEELEKIAQGYPQHIQDAVSQSKQFAIEHAAVVRRFGRYPHRNKILGRPSTPEELAFLETANTWGQ